MKVAAIQLTAGPDPAENTAQAIAAVRAAAAGGARLVVLPEKWRAIGGADALRPAAVRLDGPLVAELAALAAELRVDLVAGSLSEPGPADDARLYNASVHLTPGGGIGAVYRKVHLFDADIAGRRYRESDAEQPGRDLVATELAEPGWVAGMTICFDLRFPELYGALADLGANLVTLPAAFTERTTRDHWEVLVRARAVELGAWIVAANQCGEHPDGSRSGGRSMVVDPWGAVVARAGETEPEVVFADVDLEAVSRAREALPVRSLRRPAVYGAAPTARP